ncbi:hypothetical protein [Roseicyclus persicicus]|uniref:Twin-arginine translocation signal domain-containing protein n=1 Tax=Roseicyclus persicicus TaxID=2650661 RepID=A0A7X6H2F2_9RHOB|nr:hypothetical protein [Roseibacterium persicicum]NKX45596.1 hypothetical protein [Roseibacterium persicicum]
MSDTKTPTLRDGDIRTRRVSRRRLLGTAAGGGALTLGLLAGGRGAMAQSGPTDSDTGACADPAGYGRAGVLTGLTDADSGASCDPAGGGRWGSGLTDSDGGALADQAGNGRRGS